MQQVRLGLAGAGTVGGGVFQALQRNGALLSSRLGVAFKISQIAVRNLRRKRAGGIPIIKVLREGLVGNRITHLYGIVNGTCNYILTRMKMESADFADVLADAQRLGYAEGEPGLDVDGHDAAHKTGILASLAHGFWVNPKHIFVAGIRAITKLDIQFAGPLGYTFKLIGIVKWIAPAGNRFRTGS